MFRPVVPKFRGTICTSSRWPGLTLNLLAPTTVGARINLSKSKTFCMYRQLYTYRNSVFCPKCIYVFCVDLQTAIISLYSVNFHVFL